MSNPFFSVVIPALNEEKYLPHLLTDLSTQTYRDFEVIVVDGRSEDKTVVEAKKFGKSLPKLTILTSPRHHVCTQRNLGAKKAKGNVLIFFDADSRIDSNFLLGIRYQWDKLKVDLISPWFLPDNNKPADRTLALAMNLFIETQLKLKPTYLLESMVVISKHAFDDIDGWDEHINMSEGRWLLQNLLSKGYKFAVIREPMYHYSFRRIHKYGVLGLAGRISSFELGLLFGLDAGSSIVPKIYPMQGGKTFEKKNENLALALARINKKNQKKFNKKIQELITLLNTDIEPKSFSLLKKKLHKFLS